MQTDTPAVPERSPAAEAACAFQDHLIAARLPSWLRAATPAHMQRLGTALRRSLETRRSLERLLQRIQPIDSFTTQALETALRKHSGDDYQVNRWSMLVGNRQLVINQLPVGAHLTEVVYQEIPLLEAALRNFTAEEAKPDGQPKGNRLMNARSGRTRPLTAVEFAKLCRDTDLGGQYQGHLNDVLKPGSTDPQDAPALIANACRDLLLVDAYEARLKKVLSEKELELIEGLCATGTPSQLEGDPVVAKQLSLLSCPIEQVLVLEVVDEGLIRNTTRRVLVHIPDDANGAWCAFDSLRAFANALGRRLRQPSYQAFFSRFIPRSRSQAFFSTIIAAYADLVSTANADLDERMTAYATPLFSAMARGRIQQIKADAATIAMPVASLDRAIQQAHDQRLAAEGWTLVGLAGLFVPLIGAGLLAMTAWKLLSESFHGVRAWQAGEDAQALDHLIHVGSDLAIIAATAAGVTVARNLWTRSAVVDAMVPARLDDGSVKLWDRDLTRYRSGPPPATAEPDSEGIYRVQDRAWVKMAGQHYRVVQQPSTGRWRIASLEGHGPELVHNGAGSWRLWSEQPASWTDRFDLFRRFGGDFSALTDDQIDQVLAAHGFDASHLRALHINLEAPPAELVDTVERYRLDQRIEVCLDGLRDERAVTDTMLLKAAQALPGTKGLDGKALADVVSAQRRTLFEAVYDAGQETATAEVKVLCRQFVSLHRRVAEEILQGATDQEIKTLKDEKRVPLRLAQIARASVRQIRVARVYEAFDIEAPQSLDVAKAALSLLKYLPSPTPGLRWRLIEGTVDSVQLFDTEQGDQVLTLLHDKGQFQRVNADKQLIGAPGELFEVMASGYTESQRSTLGLEAPLGESLKSLLGKQARLHRQALVDVLTPKQTGRFRPPQRLANGRLGYLLDGLHSTPASAAEQPQALSAMLREIYPSFSDAQVTAWINQVRSTGRTVEAELARLRQELDALEGYLYQWQRQSTNLITRTHRRYLRNAMVACWQRRLSYHYEVIEESQTYRFTLHGVALETLPELPASVSFAHVAELSLLNMGITEVTDAFLRAFPNLEILELSGNQLVRIPRGVIDLRRLRELDLFNNQIVLDPGQSTILASCEHLDYLNLSLNPLGRTFSVNAMNGLRRLYLRSTGIRDIPHGLLDRQALVVADLRANQLTELPDRFYTVPHWVRRCFLFTDNPLTEEESVRLRTARLALGAQPPDPVEGLTLGELRHRWLDASELLERGELSTRWENVYGETGSEDFFYLLARLLETADFQRSPRYLVGRVFGMIYAMHEHAELARELFTLATDTVTCNDSAALCFSNLELRMLVWQAEQDPGTSESALSHLGVQLWRLDEIDRIALQDIQTRRASGADPDEIEVALAYRVALRDALDLPAQPGDMMFARVSGLTAETIAQARADVLQRETADAIVASLVEREFWQDYLLRTQAARFETMDAPFRERLEAVWEGPEVTDSEHVAQIDGIREEWVQARRALMTELSLPIIQHRLTVMTAESS